MDYANRRPRMIARHRKLKQYASEVATFLAMVATLTAGCWSLTERGSLALASALSWLSGVLS